jgi:hypothetical protein
MTLLATVVTAIILACVPALQLQAEEPRMTSIQDVKRKHEAELMAMRGVVSVGIGRNESGQAIIIVGFDRDRPRTRAGLPRDLEGYEVRAEIVGTVRTQ